MFSSKILGSQKKKKPYYFTHVGELKTSCVNVLLITCKISPSSTQFGIFSRQSNISFQLFYMSGRSQKINFVKVNTAKFDMYCNLANILGKQIFPFSRFLQYWRIFQQHSRSEIKLTPVVQEDIFCVFNANWKKRANLTNAAFFLSKV